MKKIWEAIKAIFAIRKVIKNPQDMNLETIRKIWVLIGTVIAAVGFNLPPFIVDLFGTAGTELVFQLLGAGIAIYQFVQTRIGSKDIEPAVDNGDVQQLSNVEFAGKAAYWFPFTSGPKKK